MSSSAGVSRVDPGCEVLSIVGSVGIPNRYGGPEAFAESVAPAMLERGFRVLVTCDRARYTDDLSADYLGVQRVFVPIPANGTLSPLHDLFAFLATVFRSDCVLVLGVSGGLFFPLFRLVSALAGCRLIVNIDGVEWRRSKFGPFGRGILFLSDWLAQRFSHVVIYDNLGLLPYVRFPRKATCVEYIGDQAAQSKEVVGNPSMGAGGYALTVCRIEPENNCEMLIEGFLVSSLSQYIFVGNWDRSEYGRDLRTKYAGEPRLRLLDPVYEKHELARLRSSCSTYLHGHSVGGTNPSLVEILYFDCRIFCFDCVFNRETAEDVASYFSDAKDLGRRLRDGEAAGGDRLRVRSRYTTNVIADKLAGAVRPEGRAAARR